MEIKKIMKQMKMILCVVVMVSSFMASAQNERMLTDIKVAENILATLSRQESGGSRGGFFPSTVTGNYAEGYGITFRVPAQRAYTFNGLVYGAPAMEVYSPDGFTATWSTSEDDVQNVQRAKAATVRAGQGKNTGTQITGSGTSQKLMTKKQEGIDSAQQVANVKFMDVAKSFLADYGDVLSQLKPEERIVITNRNSENFFINGMRIESNRNLMSVEAKREDITLLKQGKMTRDQFMKKLVIVNAEAMAKVDPDLEVLASMFSRLYDQDLSKTYYSQGDVSYERLNSFGVIYYMRVYSSVEQDGGAYFAMPTLSVTNLSQEARDKKVKELYPAFESSLKENLVEYGRTLRSLKEDEMVTINTKLTKCLQCGIPSTLEVSIKNSVLQDYSSGKITKEAAIAKVTVKKGGNQ